ncbi:SDR family oxidoreductase [Actinomycetes bacterium KLBMP 9797]
MESEAGVALITGASRGLGASIAVHLAKQGHPVAVNYQSSAEAARRVVEAIRGAGGMADAFAADVTDETQVSDLVNRVNQRLGPVDVLVVNATGSQPEIRVEDLTWQEHLDQLVYFVKSPTLLVQAALPHMKARRHGRIIQIGSDIFDRALPGMSAYVAAKGAQLGLTRSWARELGTHNITVNLVAPGWVPVERHSEVAPSSYEEYVRDVPLRRFGQPADVAAAVAFLASEAAAFITGEQISVNGGHTIH